MESTWNIKNHIDEQANGMNQRNVRTQWKKSWKKKTLNPKTSPLIKYNHEINKKIHSKTLNNFNKKKRQ